MSTHTERYEDEVAEIRERMMRRVDLLADEFAPQSLLAKVTGNPEAGLNDAIEIAADTVRRNPLASALIGAGVLGIIASRATDRVMAPAYEEAGAEPGVEGLDADGRRYAASGARRQTLNEKISERTTQMTHAAKSRIDEMKTQASDLASDASEAIGETARSVKAATADTIDSARETLKNTADDLGRRGREAGDAAARKGRETGRWIKDNPVATGLMVMAAGAAIGSVLTARRGGQDAGETASEALEHEAEKRESGKDGRKGADRFEQLAGEAEPKRPAKKTSTMPTPTRQAGSRGSSPAGTPNGTAEPKTSVGTAQK